MRIFLAVLGLLFANPSFSQAFPAKPVKVVVPFPPGGSADTGTRILCEKLAEEWKQPVLVENRAGAGTTIAAAYAAGAPPDGYTLYSTGPISHAASAALYRNLSYDALKSFAAVARFVSAPFVLVVNPALPASSVNEFVHLAKTRANPLTYASSGSGAAPHLATELLAQSAGLSFVHVPYKGNAPALVALLAGQVDFQISDITVMPQVRAGKLRALAVTTATPSPLVPGVPPLAESGIPGFDVPSALVLLAPAATPREVVQRVNASIGRALAADEVRQRLAAQGFETAYLSAEDAAAFLAAEVEKYARIIRGAGIRID